AWSSRRWSWGQGAVVVLIGLWSSRSSARVLECSSAGRGAVVALALGVGLAGLSPAVAGEDAPGAEVLSLGAPSGAAAGGVVEVEERDPRVADPVVIESWTPTSYSRTEGDRTTLSLYPEPSFKLEAD